MAREIEKENYKKIPLEILLYVSDFCEKNEIRYSLAYGTLLGAIRHKGYIPWDDDIDIIMPRVDYERFKKLYHSDRFVFSDMSVNKNHPTSMAKIYDSRTYFNFHWIKRSYGLFIDVFVVDNFPTDIIERQKWQKLTKKFIKIHFYKNITYTNILQSKGVLSRVKKFLLKSVPIPKRIIQKKISELYQKYNGEYTGLVGIVMYNGVYPADFFEDFIEVEFENHKFKAIRKFDDWLRICYGDYMQFPPVEERVGRHGIVAYYKE